MSSHQQRTWLISEFPKHVGKDETDILNLRDELLAAVNRLLYLFTLK